MSIDWYPGQMQRLAHDVRDALEMTAEAMRTDILQRQVMPFAEDSEENRARGVVPGELQQSLAVDAGDSASGVVHLVSNTPYARYLYYHPEFEFYKGTNPNAGGGWYEPYIDGARRSWVSKTYAEMLRRRRS